MRISFISISGSTRENMSAFVFKRKLMLILIVKAATKLRMPVRSVVVGEVERNKLIYKRKYVQFA